MSERRVTLVTGYHPETPAPPEEARTRPPFRFAVVLDSYRSGSPDMVFDDALFVTSLRTIADVLAADHVEIRMEPLPSGFRRRAPLAPLVGVQSLSGQYALQPPAEREPPALVRFRRGSERVALGASELWARVGGLEP